MIQHHGEWIGAVADHPSRVHTVCSRGRVRLQNVQFHHVNLRHCFFFTLTFGGRKPGSSCECEHQNKHSTSSTHSRVQGLHSSLSGQLAELSTAASLVTRCWQLARGGVCLCPSNHRETKDWGCIWTNTQLRNRNTHTCAHTHTLTPWKKPSWTAMLIFVTKNYKLSRFLCCYCASLSLCVWQTRLNPVTCVCHIKLMREMR